MDKSDKINELANMATLRNHLFSLLNGARNAMKRQDVQPVSALVQYLDTEIIKQSIELFKDTTAEDDMKDISKRVAEERVKIEDKKGKKIAVTKIND